MLITPDTAAVEQLLAEKPGGVIAYPTETFYGLGASIHDDLALERIVRAKGREASKGMIILVADMAMAETLAVIEPPICAVLERIWPAPLSVVLSARPGLHELLCVNGKVSLRISPHPLASALVRATGPLTSTSANPAGRPPADTVQAVVDYQLDIDAIVDGGRTPGGKPSTLADFSAGMPVSLRDGAYPFARLLALYQGIKGN